MSLTGTHHIFGGISETGIDNFLDVFFTARPHLLAYGTPFFAGDPSQVTLIDTSSLPVFLAGLQALISFSIPQVDITPPNAPGELLPPGADEFTISTEVTIDFLCGPSDFGKRGDRAGHDILLTFEVAALCKPIVVDSTPGTGSIGVSLVEVKIAGITSDGIEQILECILTRLLAQAFSRVTIPFHVFTLDGVSLTLQQGPVAADDQIEVFGDIS